MKTKHFNVKKLSAILLAIFLILPVVAVVSAADPAPAITATENWGDPDKDGIFEVSSAADLLAMANKRKDNKNYAGKTIILTADIDLNPGWDAVTKTAPTNTWTSMFEFNGTIDGQGHTLSGLYCSSGDNASFITNLAGATIKDLKVENSYFVGTGKNAGLFACVKNESFLENLYVDVIVEANGEVSGGIVSWMSTSAAGTTPKVTMTNCVFVGDVSSKGIAGGLLGINGNTGPTGIEREAIMIDCANYGTVTATDCAGGLIGKAIGVATLTRCYNGGDVIKSIDNSAALVNAQQKKTSAITLNDCYYQNSSAAYGMTKNETATELVINYDNAAATDVQLASVEELLKKTAFSTWAVRAGSDIAMPGILVCRHDYESRVIEPSCAERGYTLYTCKDCGNSYEGDYVEKLEHTEAEDWIIDKEPTEEAAGSRHKECTVCGSTLKNEIIKKLGSSTKAEDDDETTAPATTEPTTNTSEKKDEGCGSSIAISSVLGITVLCSMGLVAVRKKEND